MPAGSQQSHAAQVERLLNRMSWAEKRSQLQIAYIRDDVEALEVAASGIGAMFWPRSAEKTNALQRAAVEESRLGIPLLIGLDVIHGQYTMFPIPLAQGCSFDPVCAETDASISAQESSSGGVSWTMSPMIDVSRDPRWGRVAEGFGEDVYLTGVMGAAKVRGYQGNFGRGKTLLACAKHFVAYGQPEGGRDYNAVDLSEQRLRNVYLEPFHAAVKAGVGTVMASFNTVSGRPMHAHARLLTGVLKREWQHAGFVVGDANGVQELIPHGVAHDLREAGLAALSAGLDMEMGMKNLAVTHLTDGDEEALRERVDDAVRRILRVKFQMGLFEQPYVETAAERTAPTPATRAQARTVAARCLVLLKNDGTLPLRDDGRRILLVGPYAQSTDLLGTWTQAFAAPATSLAENLEAALAHSTLTCLPGAVFAGSDPQLQEEALAAAREHDLVIVAVGEPSALSGEAASRSQLRLPGDQEALIRAIASTGKPFVVVLFGGRPLILGDWIDQAPCVLEAWHPGTEGGAAVVDVLTGQVNPGGKLAMSFPRHEGQIPIYYAHENTGRPPRVAQTRIVTPGEVDVLGPGQVDDHFKSKYLDLELGPQFEFGHGLSYTTFSLTPPVLAADSIPLDALLPGKSLEVRVTLTNTGPVSGDEVVQLYLRDRVASLAQPVRRLRGFKRVTLQPGETQELTFALGQEDLGFWNDAHPSQYVIEPGEFEVHVGTSVSQTQHATLTVV